MKAASPIVKLGKMMWNEIVNANWMRASRRASNSMGAAALACRRARILPPFARSVERRERAHCHSSRKTKRAIGRQGYSVASCASGARPEAHHAVGAGRRQMLPVGREGDSGRPAAMAAQGAQDAAAPDVPDAHGAVLAGGGKQVLARREGNVGDAPLVTRKRAQPARRIRSTTRRRARRASRRQACGRYGRRRARSRNRAVRCRVRLRLSVCRSHRRTVLSALPEASRNVCGE